MHTLIEVKNFKFVRAKILAQLIIEKKLVFIDDRFIRLKYRVLFLSKKYIVLKRTW